MTKIKNKLIECFNILRKQNNLLEWVAVALIILFSMFTMFYSDFQGTMDFAYQTTNQIMHGNLSGLKYFFSHPYGMTMGILLIVWMLPFYPFTLLSETKFWYYGSLAATVWSKLFLTVITVIFIIAIYKIAKLISIKDNNRKWLPIFVFTSAFYFVPVVEIGQCDIIGLTFMLWGIYYYLKDDIKKFIIFFAIAIPMKYFALFIFIPLVLLREKNPLKIILQGVGGGSVMAVNFIIRKMVYGTFLGEFTSNALSTMTGTEGITNAVEESTDGAVQIIREVITSTNTIEDYFGTYIGNSSIFVIAFILICVLSYAITDNYKQWVIYIPFLVYTSFITLSPTNIYWSVLMLPFMSLVIFSNEKQLRLSMMLETIAGWAFMFISCFSASWVVGGENTFSLLFLKNMINGSDLHTFLEYEMGLDSLLPYANSVYVACIVGLVLLNLPCLANGNGNKENAKFDRWIIWGRIAIVYIWVLFLVYLMIIR